MLVAFSLLGAIVMAGGSVMIASAFWVGGIALDVVPGLGAVALGAFFLLQAVAVVRDA